MLCIHLSPWQRPPGQESVRFPLIGRTSLRSDAAGSQLSGSANINTGFFPVPHFLHSKYADLHVLISMRADLVWCLDVYKSLNKVRAMHLGKTRVEGMLTLAGDDHAHQAGTSQNLIYYIFQTCRHKQTK